MCLYYSFQQEKNTWFHVKFTCDQMFKKNLWPKQNSHYASHETSLKNVWKHVIFYIKPTYEKNLWLPFGNTSEAFVTTCQNAFKKTM